jgi:hypothetical protein
MNVWTDIAIANIQRKRPPPLDVDLETRLIGSLYACNQCGEEKTESGYYFRTQKNGSQKRSAVCKSCELEKERNYRALNAKPRPMSIEELIVGALTQSEMIVSDLSIAVGHHRRSVDKALDELILEGIVEQHGYVIKKYHPRVMKYRLTQSRPSAGERNAL